MRQIQLKKTNTEIRNHITVLLLYHLTASNLIRNPAAASGFTKHIHAITQRRSVSEFPFDADVSPFSVNFPILLSSLWSTEQE